MPWNCLCSSKEKRKLEISSPIIIIEDSSNQQLVSSSLKPRPFILPASDSTKYLSNNNNNQKLSDKSILKNGQQQQNFNGNNNKKTKKIKNCNIVSSINSSSTTTTTAKKVTEIPTDFKSNSGKKLKKQKNLKDDKKKFMKQQKKLITKNCNNNGINNGNNNNDKITKQLANVKFAFDKSITIPTPSISADDTHVESYENNEKLYINESNCYENNEKIQRNSPVFLFCNSITNNAAIITTTAAAAAGSSFDNNKINENVINVDSIQETEKDQQHYNLHKQQQQQQQKNEKRLLEMLNENAGNYDEIPFVVNDENFITKNKNTGQNSITQELLQQIDENNIDNTIPFIDEELIHKNTEISNNKIIVDDHNSRFITIHPQNIGSFQTITNAIIPTTIIGSNHQNYQQKSNGSITLMDIGDEQTENLYFDNQRTDDNFELNNNTVKRGSKFVITSTNEIPVITTATTTTTTTNTTDILTTKEFSPSTLTTIQPVEHDFQSWKIIKGKLCQLCHESLLKKPSCIVKCRSCDLICHNWCATSLPSIRYHDTSYIINRKWLRGGDELTFPIVHHFVNSDAKIRSDDEYNSNKINNINNLHYATDNENDKIIQQQRRRNNHKDKPRRRTRSLEKRKRPQSNNNNDDDDTEQNIETSDDDDDSEELIKKDNNNESIYNNKEKNSDEIDSSCGDISGATTLTIQKSNNNDDQQQNNNNKNNVIHLCHERVIRLEIIEKPNNHKIDDLTTIQQIDDNESHENNVNIIKNNNIVVNKNEIPEIIEPHYETIKLDTNTISSTSTTSTNNQNYSQNIIVDIHRRPDSVASSNLSSEVLMINENSSDGDDAVMNVGRKNIIITKDNIVPEFNQQKLRKNGNNTNIDNNNKRNSRSSDSSDKTITQEQLLNVNIKNSSIINNNEISKNNNNNNNNDKPIILSGKRFFYIQGTSNSSSGMSASSSSTINDIDEDSSMDDYEHVELRRSGTSQSLPVQSSQQLLPKNLNDNDIRIDHNNISKSQSFPAQTKHHQNHLDHRNTNLQISNNNNLHLHYVTQRILASILPRREPNDENDIQQSFGPHNENQLQDKYEKEVIFMLEQKHGKNYRVFDLESCISVITLERICELCKYIDKWLGSGQEKVVVLQDRDNRQRLGAAIAAYLEYLDICAINFATTSRHNKQQQRNSNGSCSQDDLRAQNAITKNWLDLDIFSMKKFLEDFIGPLRIPSHKRYINYFSGLLSGKIKLNSSPLLLKYITIESPPSWLQYNSISSDTEWNSFIKIYEGLRCVYTSDIHIIPITTRQFLYQIGNLQLRGDILIRCYQIISSNSALNNNNNNNNNNNYYGNGIGNLQQQQQQQDKRELLFSLQFHTCAMFSTEVTFKKDDLDYAWCDNRFPNDCRVTFHFNKSGKNITNDNGYVFQSPLIRTEPPNALAKSNSIENFDLSTKYQGPLDGSLYATILKSPKSSQYQQITSPSQQQQHRTSTSSVNLLTNLILPPPQFSNNIQQQQQQFDTSTPIRQTARHSVEPNRLSSTSTTTITSTSSSTNQQQQQQQQQQNNSRPGTLIRSTQSQPRNDYFYVENRPGSVQSNYRDSTNKYPPSTYSGQQQQPSKIVETTYQKTQNRTSSGHQQNYQQQHTQQNGTGRDSVRSPLTLSMDSGISSSGVLRAQQGSSVSPSSFPSQASPQEDRHRELDDILTDMLMTVQDIPDFNNKVQSNNKTNTINSKNTIYRQQQQHHNTIRSQSVIPTLPQKTIQLQPATSLYVLPVAHPTNYTTNDTTSNNNRELKRSVSYTAYGSSPPQQTIIINPYLSVKDLYDTASTTTTLTPPPSESGRDTPTQHIIVGSNRCLHHQQQYEQRQQNNKNRFDTLSSMASSTTNTLKSQATTSTTATRCSTNRCSGSGGSGGNIDLQHNISSQSSKNPHQVRTTTTQLSVSEDDDNNIPYHAREHSKPFTYGNVPNGHQLSETPTPHDEIDTSVEIFDPKMIKAQSGLSSPSLVRKFGGNSGGGSSSITTQSSTHSTLRKTPARNDFEDMLRERREKVMSEKYLISDKPTSVDHNQKWINTTVNQTNGYHYYNEPLKRSNTLDGFQRSNSTDGLSGQTWLQLQQQKLRAKKGQQLRDERQYFEEIHTEIRNRPQKSLANGRRYDGYASDTAAFGDEVDYRRPLHVQMPYNTSRTPERKYNTITTTTTTTTNKERPFVAVKRAHEQAKRENVGSPPLSPLSILNASPTGHIINQNQNGLLSMAESSRNGQNRLESDINQANDNTIACQNVYSSSYNNNNNNSNSHNNKTSINNHNNNNNNNNSNKNNNQSIINNNHNAINNNGTVTTSSTNNNVIITNNNNYHTINNKISNCQNGIQQQLQNSSSELDSLSSTANNLNSMTTNGQLALDQLLASLAIEAELMTKQLSTTIDTNGIIATKVIHENQQPTSINYNNNNNNNNELRINGDNVMNYRQNVTTETNITVKDNQDLNDVLADLNEFTRFEEYRQQMQHQTNHNNNINSNNNNNNGGCYSDSIISSNNSNSNSSNSPINGIIPRRLIAAAASESENSSSVSPSLSERSNHALWNDQMREESFSSYRSETDHELSSTGSPRPETPAFPVTPRTPYGLSNGSVSPALPPKSPTSQRKDLFSGTQKGHVEFANQNDQIFYTTRRNSNSSTTTSEPQEVAPHHVKFVRDSSKYWYKPSISREEAIALLRHAQPGTFIVRDSTTFKNAFGLVVRVAQLPPGVTAKQGGDELVRHFLVEPTSRGVRLKGCANEPVFTSLSALVYQHSIMPLALPCRLLIPDRDIQSVEIHTPAQKQLLSQGAACNVLYLYACDTESLTGEEAVRRAVSQLYYRKPLPIPTEVHFKVAQQGITLTDNTRQKFFRKHYSNNIVSFCGFDPDKRTWSIKTEGDFPVQNKTIFAFVARRSASSHDNQCHVFCDLAPNQPATAIVSFVNKVLPTEKSINENI